MKFVNIVTLHTSNSLELISNELSEVLVDELKSLYQTFEHLEYTLENGHVGMFAVIDEHTLTKLVTEYIKCGINFSVTDITKETLFGNIPIILGFEKQSELNQLIRDFISDNLSLDIVLEKINEKGEDSLSYFDKLVLKSQ